MREPAPDARPRLRPDSSTDAAFVAPHAPHVARKLIDQAAIPAAARAFAADEIDRAELMRRITPA
jgi:hypothetical protein